MGRPYYTSGFDIRNGIIVPWLPKLRPIRYPSFYVDSAAAGGGDGSISTPWNAISQINSASFVPGSYIRLKRGSNWYNSQLIPPSSGTANRPITFTTYGSASDPQPCIYRGPLKDSGWTKTDTNVWQVALTTEPKVVLFDNVLGNLVADAGSVVSEFDSCWAANVLYVYAPGDVDPSGTYGSPGIVAGGDSAANGTVRENGGIHYFTLHDFALRGSNKVGVYFNSSVVGAVLDQMTVESNYDRALQVRGIATPTSLVVKNSTLRFNGHKAIDVDNGPFTGLLEFAGNTITDNGWTAKTLSQETSAIEGHLSGALIHGNTISRTGDATWNNYHTHAIYRTAADTSATPMYVYDNVLTDNGDGFGVKTTGPAVIRNNTVTGNAGGGIQCGTNGGSIDADFTIMNNLVDDNNGNASGTSGITFDAPGSGDMSATILYNTLVENSVLSQGEIHADGSFDFVSLTMKGNNLVASATRRTLAFEVAQTGTPDIDYNLHWRPDGDPSIVWAGGYVSWSTWQGLGFDANGVNDDPLFVSGADFNLTSSSPGKAAGVDLGTTPANVNIDITGRDRDAEGDTWSMGAYQYVA